MLHPDDYEALEAASLVMGKPMAEIGRLLMKGEIAWSDVAKAAKKGRRSS